MPRLRNRLSEVAVGAVLVLTGLVALACGIWLHVEFTRWACR